MSRILVVEDNLAIAYMLAVVLHVEGRKVISVTEDFPGLLNPGSESFQWVDVIICDLMLPDTDGITVLKFMRDNYPRMHRIALTAASGNLLEEAREVSDAVFSKTEIAQLLDYIGGI
jgi:CheY-like chemotaxis protein